MLILYTLCFLPESVKIIPSPAERKISMTQTFGFTYLDCQSCTQRTHCEQCQTKLADKITRIDHIDCAQVNIPAQTLTVQFDPILEDDIEDILEDLGCFLS